MDISDRQLRSIVVGLGGKGDGMVRESGFDISGGLGDHGDPLPDERA